MPTGSERQIRNVFVLGTGRCGTTTFAKACGHISNFTAGHETLAGEVGEPRLDYPAGHIEADNRLSWFLGGLARRFDSSTTLYVHLTRGREDVIGSFEDRWNSQFRASIIHAFGHGILIRSEEWSDADRREVCASYVDSVNLNIAEFVRHHHSVNMEVENLDRQFPDFLDRIGADVELDLVLSEIGLRHNAR